MEGLSLRRLAFWNDSEEELIKATVEHIYGRRDKMEELCRSMNEHLKVARMCRVQGEHLVREYLEAFEAVKKLVSPTDFRKSYQLKKLQQFSGSLDRLLCSMMAVEELLRACGGRAWVMTALIVFAAIPQTKRYCSIFGQHLWNLYWNIFVINHVMHDVTAGQPSTSRQRGQWCEVRCKLVLQRIITTGLEDAEGELLQDVIFLQRNTNTGLGDAEVKFYQDDADRQDKDRKNLIANLTHRRNSPVSFSTDICSDASAPEEPVECELAVLLENKLQSSSEPHDFASYEFGDLKLEVGERIGRGNSKEVVKQKWCGEMVALGKFPFESDIGTEIFMHEISMLAKLQHPNIVYFIGWKRDDEGRCGYMMMELMEQDLDNLIARNPRLSGRSPFSLLVAVDILLQVVEAMIHMHECGVIYRDLKPGNILVSPKYTTKLNPQDLDVYYTVKLTDLETAKSCNSSLKNYDVDHDGEALNSPLSSECVFTTMMLGTGPFRAPEVCREYNGPRHGEGYTFAVDVYSFGMTAYQVATGSRPFESKLPREMRESAIQGERPLFPKKCARGLKEIIEKCWAGIPEDRPSFEQIKKDLWTLKYHEECNGDVVVQKKL